MFKNRKVQLLKLIPVFYFILFFISCKEVEKNKKKINQIEKQKIKTKQITDSVYIDNNNLVILNNNNAYVYKNLIVNAMSLSTSLHILSKNTFFLHYEYTASSTKMQHLYKYKFDNELFLISKEIVKLNKDKSGSSKIYLEKHIIKNQTLDELETIGNTVEINLTLNDLKAETSFFNVKEQKIGTIIYNISNIDRYVNFLDYATKKDTTITIRINNIVELNNIAYYLEQSKLYEEAIFLLEKIIKKFPNRTVAYLNLGDAYWGNNEKLKAKKTYKIYIKQMKNNKKQNKIPKQVYNRVR